MKYDWRGLLFSLWQFLNSHEGGKQFMAVVFLGPFLYVMTNLLMMPAPPPRAKGAKHTASIQTGRERRNLWVLGLGLAGVNLVTLALYIRVWFLMPDKAVQFPTSNNIVAVWGSCLIVWFLTVILLAVFITRYKKANPKS